jgi:hypothetical protein
MSTVNQITIDLTFPADYEVRLLEELPASSAVLEIARSGRVADGGVLIEVFPTTGEAWSALVANGPTSVSAAHTGVYSTPVTDELCVVAHGDAYVINVAEPERWRALEDAPVIAVRCAPSDGLLVLATPWRVVGLGSSGVAWRTSRIAIDGIELGKISDGHLRGVADPDDDESREFVIELRTGYHRGGFPFPG